MTISNATFAQDIYSCLNAHREAIDAQTRDTLITLAQRTFENADEASDVLAEYSERVQRSDKTELTEVLRDLFDREIRGDRSRSIPLVHPFAHRLRD
jgi:hypothetical protein